MPELPEAETIARSLAALLSGARVAAVRLGRRDYLKTGSPGGLGRLKGRSIDAVTRRGKCVVIHLGEDRLVLQLGMAGKVHVDPPGTPPRPHAHLVVVLADGREFRYADSRRIASGVHLLGPGCDGPLARLGPDADSIRPGEFVRRLAGRKTPIKAALLNQSIVAGVGNIYADESLFRAGIRPARRVCRIERARLVRLARAVRTVLAQAIRAGGSTLRGANPYTDANGQVGYFSTRHRAYGRFGQACVRCGAALRRGLVAGRTTTFCPRCQK